MDEIAGDVKVRRVLPAERLHFPAGLAGRQHHRAELLGESAEPLVHPADLSVFVRRRVFRKHRDRADCRDLGMRPFLQRLHELPIRVAPLVEIGVGAADVRGQHVVHAEHDHEHVRRLIEVGLRADLLHVEHHLGGAGILLDTDPVADAHPAAAERHELGRGVGVGLLQGPLHLEAVAGAEPAAPLARDAVAAKHDAGVGQSCTRAGGWSRSRLGSGRGGNREQGGERHRDRP